MMQQEDPAPDVSINALLGWYGGAKRGERTRLDWVICGGESGPKADPMFASWARKVRDNCAATGTPFFFKQWGSWQPAELVTRVPGRTYHNRYRGSEKVTRVPLKSCNLLDGELHQAFPR